MIVGLAAHLPNLALQLALASLAGFFLLVDGHRLLSWMTDKIPLAADVRGHVVQSFQETAISVIWATLAAAAAQSVVMLLSYLTLGVPAAFLAAEQHSSSPGYLWWGARRSGWRGQSIFMPRMPC
jgi:predicted PurR-regulated permease PerM